MLNDLLLLFGGLVVLIGGGEFLVRGASSIALRSNISPLVVGLTIVAFGTSAPELFISLQSALAGKSDMTMGNVVGSNICNLALVLGITSVFAPIQVNEDSIRIDWPMAMGSSVLLYLLAIEGYLERYEGVFFVLLLIGYVVFLVKKSRKDARAAAAALEDLPVNPNEVSRGSWLMWGKDILFIALGALGLTFGSDWFVAGAADIFLKLGFEERVIGIVVLALGTSLPELVTSIVAALKQNTDLAIGNLMGSNIFNVLSILGITSIVQDIHVSDGIQGDMIWMLGITLVVLPMMIYKRRLGRIQGGVLLLIYGYYIYSIIPV